MGGCKLQIDICVFFLLFVILRKLGFGCLTSKRRVHLEPPLSSGILGTVS